MIHKIYAFLLSANFSFVVILVGLFILILSYVFFLLLKRKQKKKIFIDKISFIFSKYLQIAIGGGVIFLIGILLLFSIPPKIVSQEAPAFEAVSITPANPVIIRFDRPFFFTKLQRTVSPDFIGHWRTKIDIKKRHFLLVFTPEISPRPNERYTFSLNNIQNFIKLKSKNYLFSVLSQDSPKLKSINISQEEVGFLPDQQIVVEIDGFDKDTADLSYAIEPSIDLDMVKTQSGFILTPRKPFIKGMKYNLALNIDSIQYYYALNKKLDVYSRSEIFKGSFTVISAPGITSFSPHGGGVLVDSPVVVKFTHDMNRGSVEANFIATPSIAGLYTWSNDREMTYKPSANLEKNTKYQFTIGSRSQLLTGENLPEDFKFEFSTIGHVAIASISPINKSANVALNRPITIVFNQAVDKPSAESSFTITPAISGNFTWDGNSMIFNHADFPYSTGYKVNVSSGIKSVNGLDSNQSYEYRFTTKSQSVVLDVPSYKQAHMYSCMGTAARNALDFKGVSASENEILSRIGYDMTSWSGSWNSAGSVWGDPDVGIVGNVDGKANNIGWGYGSHWDPVAKAIGSYGKTAEVKSGWNVSGIAQELANGNPVIVWWVNGVWPAYEVRWNNNGKSIRAVNSMHVQVVKGFTGSIDHPATFTVTDSGYGYPSQVFDVSTFKAKWNWFNNTAVVVK